MIRYYSKAWTQYYSEQIFYFVFRGSRARFLNQALVILVSFRSLQFVSACYDMWRFRFYRRDIMSLGNFVYHLIPHLFSCRLRRITAEFVFLKTEIFGHPAVRSVSRRDRNTEDSYPDKDRNETGLPTCNRWKKIFIVCAIWDLAFSRSINTPPSNNCGQFSRIFWRNFRRRKCIIVPTNMPVFLQNGSKNVLSSFLHYCAKFEETFGTNAKFCCDFMLSHHTLSRNNS